MYTILTERSMHLFIHPEGFAERTSYGLGAGTGYLGQCNRHESFPGRSMPSGQGGRYLSKNPTNEYRIKDRDWDH